MNPENDIRTGYELSPETNEIIPAFIEFQHRLNPVKKTMENKVYEAKYENINDILEMIREPLYNCKLAIMQIPNTLPLLAVSNKEKVLKQYNGQYGPYEKLIWTGNYNNITVREIMITTILWHTSGQYIKSWYIETPEDNSHHSKGKAITYARKFSIRPILGIAAEDEDGNPILQDSPKKQNLPEKEVGEKKETKPMRQTATVAAEGDRHILDKDNNFRYDKIKNILVDEYQKNLGLIETADLHNIQALLKNNNVKFKQFANWLRFTYQKRFFDIHKINEFSHIIDVLTNNINLVKEIPEK